MGFAVDRSVRGVAERVAALRSLVVPDGDSLRRNLWIGAGAGIACTATLAGFVVLAHVADYRAARESLSDIACFRQVLDTVNGLSAERGPANSVMGEPPSADSASHRKLAERRARNDAALAQLGTRLALWTSRGSGTVGPSALVDVAQALARAREEVDRVAATPLGERSSASVQRAVHRMFGVVDAFERVTARTADDILRRHEGIKAQLLAAEMLGELREHAGRMASEIMPSVATRERLRTADIVASSRTRGRLSQIWALIGRQASLLLEDPDIVALRTAVDARFFGEGLALFDHMVEQGADSGLYDLDPTAFTARFVPTLAPIEQLRTAFLDAWVARSVAAQNHALTMLLLVGGTIGLAVAALVGALASVQRNVFTPLLIARERVIALAEGRTATVCSASKLRGEMRCLFEAIAVLQDKVHERALLTQQLRRQADTDLLTGLPNRRALHREAERLQGRGGGDAGICLIMVDLDHFKTINDRHGHPAGDEVLRQVAACLTATVAAGGTAARFGGEEFAILVPHHDIGVAVTMAHAVRSALEIQAVSVGGGVSVALTASFGVAASDDRGGTWDSLVARADAALYRAKAGGRNRVCRQFCDPAWAPALARQSWVGLRQPAVPGRDDGQDRVGDVAPSIAPRRAG